jgi:DNA primase
LTDEQKIELIRRVEEEHGVHKLFVELGLKEVTKKGKNVYCVCPMHEGADNPTGFCYSNGFGYCFTQCNRSYDLFHIVMKARSCDFADAIGFLGNLVGMDIDFIYKGNITHDGSENREFLSQVKRIKQRKKIADWKPIDPVILNDFTPSLHKMLRDEGFDNSVREYFGLGYAQTGYLEHRITIPIDYIDGSIVTVSGRSVLPDEILKDRKIRRYQIWFDTEKSVTLYNISRALPYIEITKEVIVVEGFKAVWRLYQWGYGNAVATMGSSLSEEQRKMLLKLNCRIVTCGDKDEAGTVFNHKIALVTHKFTNIEVMDMFMLDVPESSSIDNITKEQFLFLSSNRKEGWPLR